MGQNATVLTPRVGLAELRIKERLLAIKKQYFSLKHNYVAALSKACVCGRSFTGIAGSNPACGMDVCLL
jgi:hypothetical protein